MENKSLKCPQCGATMTVNPDKTEAVCDYCGHKILLKKEKSDEEKIHLAEEVSHAREVGHQQAIEEAQTNRQKRRMKKIGIVIGVLAVVFCAVFFFTQNSKPEINPFDYIEISFSGVNGEGKGEIKTLNGKDDIDVSNLSYEISPSNNLSEGDYVTVTVSSKENQYRLTSTSKKYQVEGLQQYLTDLKSLDENQLQVLYDQNKELQEYNLDSAYSDVQFGEITPVRICLLTGNNDNILFVISKVTCTYEDLSKTHYLVSEMDDVVTENGNISFGTSSYDGNLSGSVSENGRGFIYSCSSLEGAIADIKSSNASLTYSEMVIE